MQQVECSIALPLMNMFIKKNNQQGCVLVPQGLVRFLQNDPQLQWFTNLYNINKTEWFLPLKPG
jgi:hypothetical protein